MRNTVSILMLLAFFITLTAFGQHSKNNQNNMMSNKQLVEQKFKAWEEGTAEDDIGTVFDLLDDQVEWIMPGISPISGAWQNKRQYMEEVVAPINKKMKTRLIPELLNIYGEGDILTVLWKGHATAEDGMPYENDYCWILEMKNKKIVKITAYLDTYALTQLMARTPKNIFKTEVRSGAKQ